MILTVTPNPALDVTYEVDALRLGAVHRVAAVRERPGGKGINVARVLHAVGSTTVVTGFSGGPGGMTLKHLLGAEGIATDLVDTLPDVRRTLVIRDRDDSTTSLWEPGYPPADPAEAEDLLVRRMTALLAGARAVTISGSLPPGVAPALPSRLAGLAAAAGVPVIVDVDGDALRAAAETGLAMLVPNQAEAAELAGKPISSPAAALAAATEILRAGQATAVAITLGGDGLALAHPGGCLRAIPPEVVRGNPTGAGDAACAALARHLAGAGSVEAVDWPQAAADAVAMSAAAVLRPVAGEIDPAAYRRWRENVVVEDG